MRSLLVIVTVRDVNLGPSSKSMQAEEWAHLEEGTPLDEQIAQTRLFRPRTYLRGEFGAKLLIKLTNRNNVGE